MVDPLNEKEREVLREKRKSLGPMYFKQKLKSITISFAFSLILSVFFITDYFLVSTTFDESVASVQMF